MDFFASRSHEGTCVRGPLEFRPKSERVRLLFAERNKSSFIVAKPRKGDHNAEKNEKTLKRNCVAEESIHERRSCLPFRMHSCSLFFFLARKRRKRKNPTSWKRSQDRPTISRNPFAHCTRSLLHQTIDRFCVQREITGFGNCRNVRWVYATQQPSMRKWHSFRHEIVFQTLKRQSN